jgi:hypothetical protein
MEIRCAASHNHRGRGVTALLLLIAAVLSTTATAAAATPVPAPQCGTHRNLTGYLCVAYAQDPAAPCVGQVRVTFTEDLANADAAAEATGIVQFGDQDHPAPEDQPDELMSCDITVRASAWRTMSRPRRCVVITHEVEHLAGHRHYEGTAMNDRAFAPCDLFAPLADRAITRLVHLRGATNVGCSTGSRIVRCDVEFGSRTRKYRVRLSDARLVVHRITD